MKKAANEFPIAFRPLLMEGDPGMVVSSAKNGFTPPKFL
jgi:hypothetical protein